MWCEDRSTSSCESGCNCFTTLCEECIRFDVKIKALRVVGVDVIVFTTLWMSMWKWNPCDRRTTYWRWMCSNSDHRMLWPKAYACKSIMDCDKIPWGQLERSIWDMHPLTCALCKCTAALWLEYCPFERFKRTSVGNSDKRHARYFNPFSFCMKLTTTFK